MAVNIMINPFPYRCERIGMFKDSLYYLQEMLPYIAATGHNLYTTDLWLYLQIMKELEEERPELFRKFSEGFATLRRTDKYYGGIPSDQIIEQMLMRALKTRGGLTRGRGFTEVQQSVWLFSRNICAEVTNAVQQDLLQLNSGGSSDQHVQIGKTSDKKNTEDYLNTLEFLKSRRLFGLPHEKLENFVTGREASPSVNIFKAKDIGKAIIAKMEGISVKDFSFKRKDQAVSMGTKVKRKDGTILKCNPQNLFDRLIALTLVSTLETKTDLSKIMSFELAPFPPSLFESEDLMREAHKPQITDMLKKHQAPTPSDNAPKLEGIVVLDGGSLLYTIDWAKGSKFKKIAEQYTKFVKKHYLLPGCQVKVVFDSYPQGPTTKDSTHLRRTRQACVKIRVADDTLLDITKQQYLSNSENKQNFVDYVSLKLDGIEGIECVKARDDADCLIVDTAIVASTNSPNKCVTVVGDDTDLIVLILRRTRDSTLTPGKLYFRTKKWHWDIALLVDSIKDKPYMKHSILSLHANSGCDTTSRIFGKGKAKFFNIDKDDEEYWAAVDVFEQNNASKTEIADAGRTILRTVCSTAEERKAGLTLNQLRAARYTDKSLKAASVITAESLPPTSDAADLHSLRAYLQVQQWLGNDLDAEQYGFHLTNGMYLPIPSTQPVAPEFLLDGIFCKCKGNCDTNSCKCYKAQLSCNNNCENCEGKICNNKETQIFNPFDDDD